MPNIAGLLKDEIVRLARREVRVQTASLQRASAAYRRDIAALKRQNASLQRVVQALAKRSPQMDRSQSDGISAEKLRFRVDGFKSMRARLGLSAEQLAALIGVSPQSVYGWEHGRTVPRRSQLPSIAAVRKMGKREVLERLSELKAMTTQGAAHRKRAKAKV